MRKLNLLFAIVLLFFIGKVQAAQLSCYNVVGYLPSWIGSPADIDYSKYTHINYAFGIPNSNGTIGAIENSSKLTDLVTRGHANNTKILLAVGGWLNSSPSNTPFDAIAVNPTYVTNFVNACANLITQYNLDGIDLDWEYPTSQAHWNSIITPLATRIHGMGKLLTAAVPANGYNADMIGIITGLDLVNIMSYDCACPTVAPYSQAVSSLQYWTDRGVPQNKRMLGVPFYSSDNYTSLHVQKANLSKTNGGGIMIWDIATYYGDINSIVTTLGTICKGSVETCATVNLPGTVQAENYCNMSGIQTQSTTDTGGGLNVGYIETGDWMSYKVNVPSTGTYKVEYRVASQNGGGSIRLESYGGGSVFGTISVSATGGWQSWSTISHEVTLNAGTQTIAIAAAAGGFNINWFKISPVTTGGTPIGSYIMLKGNNGLYVSGKNGTAAMICNISVIGSWLKFKVVDAGNGLIALQAGSNSKYVTGSSPMWATASTIGDAQKFSWIPVGSNQVQLKCSSNNMFVCSENGTTSMNCNRATASGWETFTWELSTKSATLQDESIDPCNGEAAITVFPNPAKNGQFTLNISGFEQNKAASYKVINAAGKVVDYKQISIDGNSQIIPVSLNNVSPGMYLISVESNGLLKTRNFVVE